MGIPNWRIEGKQRMRLRLRNTIKKEIEMDVEVKELIGVSTRLTLTSNLPACFLLPAS